MDELNQQSTSQRPPTDRWRRYWYLLRRRWWVLLLCMSALVCQRAYKLKQLPDEYVSAAKLVLQGRIQLDKSSSYQEEMTNLFGTQKEILSSRQLRARVKEHMKVLHPDLESSPVQIQVSRESYSSVINIKAKGRHGIYSQAYLNSVLDQYMTLRGEMRTKVSNQTLSAINEQLARLTEQIEKEKAAVAAFHQANDLIVLQEGENTAATYLAELIDKRADLVTRLNYLRKLDIEHDINRRSQLPPSAPSADGTSRGHLAESERDFLRTKREMAMLQVEHDRLATIMKPKHPKIRELKSRIERASALLKVFRDQSETVNEQRARSLEVELANLEQEISKWEEKTLDASRRLAESKRLTENLDRTRNLHEKLLLSMHDVDQARNLDQDHFSIMEKASAPSKIQPGTTKPLMSAALIGLILGTGILLLLNRFDDTLHTASEYFERFHHDFLGSVPEIDATSSLKLVEPNDERSFFAESYRKLRSSILYKKWEQRTPRTMLVTSAIPFDGKSTVASNLAAVLAMSGSEVLLIDADLRRGALHDRFSCPLRPGLSEVLRGTCSLYDAIVETERTNLDLLPRGNPSADTVESILNDSTQRMFDQLEAVYDHIVIDSAPVLVADDTLSMAPLVDTTLFVIRLDRTPGRLAERALDHLEQRQAERALDHLEQRQVDVGGVILNFDHTYAGEYYAYDYSKYYTKLASS